MGSMFWWTAIKARRACSIFQAVFWETPTQVAMATDDAPLLEQISEDMT